MTPSPALPSAADFVDATWPELRAFLRVHGFDLESEAVAQLRAEIDSLRTQRAEKATTTTTTITTSEERNMVTA